jgi:hypothetical protein
VTSDPYWQEAAVTPKLYNNAGFLEKGEGE